MAKELTATAFTNEFQSRVKKARKAKKLRQRQVAKVLGVDQGTYKQWETRPGSLLPHEHVESFCIACEIDFEWLFTGQMSDKRPEAAPVLKPKRQRRRTREAARDQLLAHVLTVRPPR